MSRRKFVLGFDERSDRWVFRNEGSEKVIRTFARKEEATRTGVLQRLVGKQGGTVRISTRGGTYAEERSFRER